jgi:hypothetical protein
MAAHSYKDLEKLLPAATTVHKMQLKDFVQALTDEGLVRVEKIGGANWYWSFGSDGKAQREKVLNDLIAEEAKLQAAITELDTQIQEEMTAREEDDEMLEDGGLSRKELLEEHESLLQATAALTTELERYKDNDPAELLRQADEIKRLKEDAEKWTDYIEGVAGLLKNVTGDKGMIAQMMESICGDEYIPGEGLKEL